MEHFLLNGLQTFSSSGQYIINGCTYGLLSEETKVSAFIHEIGNTSIRDVGEKRWIRKVVEAFLS